MRWFRRHKEAEEATLVASLTKALGEAVVGVLQVQGAQIAQSTAFLGTLQDLSAKKAAQIMGGRGGRTTQERKRKRKEAERAAIQCRLCTNPMARGVTLQEIDIHRAHEMLVEAAPPPAQQEPERGN